MSATVTTRSTGLRNDPDEPSFPAPNGKLIRLPVAPAALAQRILAVEFRSPDGRSWDAIGGGATVAAAIDWARECCPDDTTWELVGWEDLYGD
jgi:hypothetical protein